MGRVLEHPNGYVVVDHHPGVRALFELQSFLPHTGQLLHLPGWHKLLSDHRVMTPFSVAERDWILDYWLARQTESGTSIVGAGV